MSETNALKRQRLVEELVQAVKSHRIFGSTPGGDGALKRAVRLSEQISNLDELPPEDPDPIAYDINDCDEAKSEQPERYGLDTLRRLAKEFEATSDADTRLRAMEIAERVALAKFGSAGPSVLAEAIETIYRRVLALLTE